MFSLSETWANLLKRNVQISFTPVLNGSTEVRRYYLNIKLIHFSCDVSDVPVFKYKDDGKDITRYALNVEEESFLLNPAEFGRHLKPMVTAPATTVPDAGTKLDIKATNIMLHCMVALHKHLNHPPPVNTSTTTATTPLPVLEEMEEDRQ